MLSTTRFVACVANNATLYGVDRRGYCFVAQETQRSILHIWHQIVAEGGLQVAAAEPNREGPALRIERAFGTKFASPSFQAGTAAVPMAEVIPAAQSGPAATIAAKQGPDKRHCASG